MLKKTQRSSAFRAAFSAHLGVAHVRVATAKTVRSQTVSPSDLGDYEFFTPPSCLCPALIVDVDRSFAVLDIFDTIPAAIAPSWIIETPKGAQVGWFIDPVDMREEAREHPKRYARAVGTALRKALGGDDAVDPVSATRVRNPAYKRADTHTSGAPVVYSLKTLHRALEEADLWAPEHMLLSGGSLLRADTGAISDGERNTRIFNACRFAAYRGADFEAAAWSANDRCTNPLSSSEVSHIIASVDRFMSGSYRRGHSGSTETEMPESMREVLSEMGRRGGLANTEAQRAARALGNPASVVSRKVYTDTRAREAQKLRTRGLSMRDIAKKIRVSAPTICRYMRRYVEHQPRVPLVEHQVLGAPPEPAGSSESELPRHKAGRALRESLLSRAFEYRFGPPHPV